MDATADVQILSQMRGWAEQTEARYRHVANQIASKQLAQLLLDCASDRSSIIEQLDDVIREEGGEGDDASKPSVCCPMRDFDGDAGGAYAQLLDRLASCDEQIREQLETMLDERDIKATTRLVGTEAMLLLEHTAKKLRNIIEQARGRTSELDIR